MTRAATGAIALFSLLLIVAALPAKAASPPRSNPCTKSLVKAVPTPPPLAATGTDFARRVADLDESARERLIADELLAGNIPSFLRALKPVRLQGALPSGRIVTITLCVMPDYLAIGSDRDFLRIPMRLSTALLVAGRYGFVLPTTRIVDAIYDQAEVQLAPQPLPAGDTMRSTAYYRTHDGLVRTQLEGRAAALGALVAGDKKDLVLTNRLRAAPDHIAIYGWHLSSGHPIQPLNLWHGARYADYSHGARLVSQIVLVNDMQRSLYDVMSDPKLAQIISGEGPIPFPRQLVNQLAVSAEPTLYAAVSPALPPPEPGLAILRLLISTGGR